MAERIWTHWRPRWAADPTTGAPTVEARYEVAGPPDEPPEQHVEMRCLVCGEEQKRLCETGNPQAHIQRFALLHQSHHFTYRNAQRPT